MNFFNSTFIPNTSIFMAVATVLVVIWTIEMRMCTSYVIPLKANPQTFDEGLNNMMKTTINKGRGTAFMIIFFFTLLFGMYHGFSVMKWFEHHYPLMEYNTRVYWALGLVALPYFVVFFVLKPPSLVKKYRGRYLAWLISVYVMFNVYGWIGYYATGVNG